VADAALVELLVRINAARLAAHAALHARARAIGRVPTPGPGHGDTPAERDEAAIQAAHAPSRRLAVYGTLAPGESNHHLVAPLGGVWSRGTVRGRRTVRRFPAFTWDEAAPPVPVHLLVAAGLPHHWPALDEFEGADYCRILVPVVLDRGGSLVVANLYTTVQPVVA
jgi:gamma-glutamylcyclotransferase (GGCT)/AIG2-like uncharacterized protein YtfP